MQILSNENFRIINFASMKNIPPATILEASPEKLLVSKSCNEYKQFTHTVINY